MRWTLGRRTTVFLALAGLCFGLGLLMSLRMAWFAARFQPVDRLAAAVMSGYVVFMLLFQWQLRRDGCAASSPPATDGADTTGSEPPGSARNR